MRLLKRRLSGILSPYKQKTYTFLEFLKNKFLIREKLVFYYLFL